jgi:hypothetical protein
VSGWHNQRRIERSHTCEAQSQLKFSKVLLFHKFTFG